jgi:penicillin-binding protein 1A
MGGLTGILGEWGPESAENRFEGTISAREALVKSKNAATVRLGMMTGIDSVKDLAQEAGISSNLASYPKTYLGGSEVTPMELTMAYTMFPNLGTRPAKPYIISKIEDKDGKVLYEAHPEQVRVLEAPIAYEVHDCLRQVLEPDGTGERVSTEYGLKKYPLGGKTGTAYNFTDLWFVGYSSEVTCTVWMGFDQQRGKPKQTIFRGAFSKDLVLPVWAELMKATFANYKPQEIIEPKGIIRAEICRVSGGLACEKCFEGGVRTTYQEIATEDQAPRDACPIHSGTAPVIQPGIAAAKPAMEGATVPVMIPSRVPEQQGVGPVTLKEPTVIGEDPYGAAVAIARAKGINVAGNGQPAANGADAASTAGNTPDIPNTNVPVAPRPLIVPPAPSSDVKLEQPEPVKF